MKRRIALRSLRKLPLVSAHTTAVEYSSWLRTRRSLTRRRAGSSTKCVCLLAVAFPPLGALHLVRAALLTPNQLPGYHYSACLQVFRSEPTQALLRIDAFPYVVMTPDSVLAHHWDQIITLCVLYSCIVFPFELAFETERDPNFSASLFGVMWVMDYLTYICFCGDFILQFALAYRTLDGMLVLTPSHIAARCAHMAHVQAQCLLFRLSLASHSQGALSKTPASDRSTGAGRSTPGTSRRPAAGSTCSACCRRTSTPPMLTSTS